MQCCPPTVRRQLYQQHCHHQQQRCPNRQQQQQQSCPHASSRSSRSTTTCTNPTTGTSIGTSAPTTTSPAATTTLTAPMAGTRLPRPGSRIFSHNLQVKLVALSEKDDIEAYLVTFECIMEAYKVPKNEWTYHLAPQLTAENSVTTSMKNLIDAVLGRRFVKMSDIGQDDQVKCRRPLKDSNNMKFLKLRKKECDGAELTLICIV
eukprot:Em0007g131a